MRIDKKKSGKSEGAIEKMFTFSYGCYLRDVLPVEQISSNPRKLLISEESFSAITLDEKMLNSLTLQEAKDLNWKNADPARSVFNWIFDGAIPELRVYNLLYKTFCGGKTKGAVLDFFEFQSNTTISIPYVDHALEHVKSSWPNNPGFSFNEVYQILMENGIDIVSSSNSTDQEKKQAAGYILLLVNHATVGNNSLTKRWMLSSARRKIRVALKRQRHTGSVGRKLTQAAKLIDEYQPIHPLLKNLIASSNSAYLLVVPLILIAGAIMLSSYWKSDDSDKINEAPTDEFTTIPVDTSDKSPLQTINDIFTPDNTGKELDWLVDFNGPKSLLRQIIQIDSIVYDRFLVNDTLTDLPFGFPLSTHSDSLITPIK